MNTHLAKVRLFNWMISIVVLAMFVVAPGCSRPTLQGTLPDGNSLSIDNFSSQGVERIEIWTPANSSPKGTSLNMVATAIYRNGTTADISELATWSSSTPAVATVSDTSGSKGHAVCVDAGQTTIRASFGNSEATRVFTVTNATLSSIALTPATASIPAGATQAFTATGTYSDNSTVDLTNIGTWNSTQPSIATISNTSGSMGVASSLQSGMTTIEFTFEGTTEQSTLVVSSATLSSLEISPSTLSMAKGTQQQFTAMGIYSDSSTADLTSQVSWSTLDAVVASVSNSSGSKGLVSANELGNTSVLVSFSGKAATAALTVTNALLLSIDVSPNGSSLAKGLSLPFIATGLYSDGSTLDLTNSVTWNVSDGLIGTVSNALGLKGIVQAVDTGALTVSATSGSVTGQANLNVSNAALVSIDVTPGNTSLAAGVAQQYIAIGVYSDNTTSDLTSVVTWSSSDPLLSTVSNALGLKGLVSSLSAGSLSISATLGAIVGSAPLNVTNATLSSITVTPGNATIAAGVLQNYTATGTYSDASTQDLTNAVTWASTNSSVANISNASGTKGKLSSLASGTTTVSATLGLVSGSTGLTVTSATLVSVAVTPMTSSVAAGFTKQFAAIGTYSDASTADLTSVATWSSTDQGIATISNGSGTRGLANAITMGTTTIGAIVGSVSGSTTLNVTGATLMSIQVTPANTTMILSVGKQFTATGTYSDGSTQDLTNTATWSITGLALASVSNAPGSKGRVSGLALGTTTVTATVGTTSGSTNTTINLF